MTWQSSEEREMGKREQEKKSIISKAHHSVFSPREGANRPMLFTIFYKLSLLVTINVRATDKI